MLGVGVAFVVIGLICLFLAPWAGVGVVIAGAVLTALWLAGFGRGAHGDRDGPLDRRL